MLNITNAMAEGKFGIICDTFYLKGVYNRDILRKKDVAKLCLCNYQFIISAVGFVYTQEFRRRKYL
jgi:hypothetical protein